MQMSQYHYLPLAPGFFAILIGLFVIVLVLRSVRFAYESLGVSSATAMWLLFASLLGSIFNIPIAELPPERVMSDQVINFFGMQYEVPVVSHLAACLSGAAIIIAASDYVRAYPQMIAAYLEARFIALGTDGFGRSDTRQALRAFFEIDRCSVVIAALASLATEGLMAREVVSHAIERYGVNSSAPPPWTI